MTPSFLAHWLDPRSYYTGPITADLSTHPAPFEAAAAIFNFTTQAQTSARADMRNRWPDYRGLVPDALARDIVNHVCGGM